MKDICISIIYDFGMIAFNGTVIIETKRIKNGTKIIHKSLNGSNVRKVSVTKEVNPYRALINFFNKPNSYIYQFQYEYHEIINQLNICITGISGWKKNYLMLNLLCEENEKSFSRYFESFSEKILDKIFRSKNDLKAIIKLIDDTHELNNSLEEIKKLKDLNFYEISKHLKINIDNRFWQNFKSKINKLYNNEINKYAKREKELEPFISYIKKLKEVQKLRANVSSYSKNESYNHIVHGLALFVEKYFKDKKRYPIGKHQIKIDHEKVEVTFPYLKLVKK